jgi:superfamily II DNA/RNA helicase
MSFESLGLHEALNRALADAGYTTPTDVQSRAVPPALTGRDLMCRRPDRQRQDRQPSCCRR